MKQFQNILRKQQFFKCTRRRDKWEGKKMVYIELKERVGKNPLHDNNLVEKVSKPWPS